MPTEACAVRTEALSVVRPGGVHALETIDLALERGTLTALVGANGSGKSTLIGVLAGTVEPSAGAAFVLGLPPHERALRARIAYASQDVALDPEARARATLELFATLHGIQGSARRERIARAIELLDLGSLIDRPIARLSGGERRRVHLACALLHDAELLLLDEPTAGLDARSSSAFWRELHERTRSGATVLVATHELDIVEHMASEVLVLDAGLVLERGAPRDLVARHAKSHLVATLREPPLEAAKLEAFLAGFPDARAHEIDGRTLVLEVADARASAPRFLARIAEQRLDLERLELREPSLASVTRALTGADLTTSTESGGRRGRTGGR
jgi:ABC-2 type transport system ATP-binding protein